MTGTTGKVLYLGGARSGKSTLAERRLAGRNVTYIAPGPSYPDDAEWQRRIEQHRQRRPDHWQTVESSDLVSVIAAADPGQALLVDCLTLWLAATIDAVDGWASSAGETTQHAADRIAALVTALEGAPTEVVLVSNEVGSGIVPDTASGRLFRDLLGMTNTAVAAVCTEVNLVVAGLAMQLKGPAR